MSPEGTGVQIFRSKTRLTKDEAKNFEAAFLLVDGKFCLIVMINS
jgi:hypothetical protein